MRMFIIGLLCALSYAQTDECEDLDSWDGNRCYTRVTDFDGVTIDKSSTMSGTESSWVQAFSTDEYATIVHMDSASVGHYLAMTFPEPQTFNGFRFECGGNGDSRALEQNVFDLQYHDGSDWVTVGTTNSANGICGTTDTPGYAMWPAVYESTQWRYILTEQHGGPWYHGFAWYIASGNAVATSAGTCTPSDMIFGQARDFEGGMGGWSCYSNPDSGTPQGNCHTHTNYNGRTSVAHIHGGCTGTQGGIQQTFDTASGTSYNLQFIAFAGTWDGTDIDDFYVKVEGSDNSIWTQFSVAHGAWDNVELAFVASGPVTITIWSDANHCIDVDEIELEVCTDCVTTDVISGQSRDFEGGMGGWSCYSNPDSGSTQGNCHTHTNYNDRSSVAHIHGGCTGSQGGIQQTFATDSGSTYNLKFLAFAGTWDGADTDDFYIKVENSDQVDWAQFSVEHGEWDSVSHSFTASGDVTITIWADVNHCIDVDEIYLQMCASCVDTGLVSGTASDFEGNMGGWSCYDRGTGSAHGTCHTHSNYYGRTSVAHIHGSCTGTQGGIMQTFQTTAGGSYHLLFVAFAGTWDGEDTDDLYIKVDNSDKSDWVGYSIAHGDWVNVRHEFTATGAATVTIWSDVNHCIDVDDVIIQECSNEANVVTMEECQDNTDALPMSTVTGQRSSISGDVVSITMDYPGYMELTSLQFSDGSDSLLSGWDMTIQDGCREDNTAAQDFSYASIEPMVTRSGAFAEIGLTATFIYYTQSELTASAEQVVETKEIELGIRAPLTHVVSVTAPFELGASLLYDIMSHGIVDENDAQLVYVEFRTFVGSGHSFTGDCAISSPYFSTDSSACTSSTPETFVHPTDGSGTIQTWRVEVQNPDQCQDATHTERIDVDLTLATGSVERIQFMVDMIDEAGPDCRVVIGDFEFSSAVQISDGSGTWVDASQDSDMIFYLNSVMEFSVTFESLMLPTYATLASMTVTQNNDAKCDTDCFDVAQFVCENCDADGKSAGSTYTFSVVLTDGTFTALPGVSTDTSFELNFDLQYTVRRRRLTKTVDAHTVPIKIRLRDYDCKAPNAILSSVKMVDCDVVSMTKTMMCSTNGWQDVSQCAAPGERYFSIFGFAMAALIVLYVITKAATTGKDIFSYQQIPLKIQG